MGGLSGLNLTKGEGLSLSSIGSRGGDGGSLVGLGAWCTELELVWVSERVLVLELEEVSEQVLVLELELVEDYSEGK